MKHRISHHSVSRETFAQADSVFQKHKTPLNKYADQLLWWNERVNLISRDVSRETLIKHIRHSLLVGQLLPFQQATNIIDAGTGGGLPGLPLAITYPDKEFLLNDIVSKKILCVKQIAKELDLPNVSLGDTSIQAVNVDTPHLLISKHAFKINDLHQMVSHIPWSNLLFYKGLNFEDELVNIGEPLGISVHDLFEQSQDDFYKDKAIVLVSRK